MKFISYIFDDDENFGVLNKDSISVIPIEILLKKLKKEAPENLLEFIRIYSDSLISDLREVIKDGDNRTIALKDIKITAPIQYPRRNIFCLGKNYIDHAIEMKKMSGEKGNVPDYPVYFTKVADPAIGHMDKIVIPKDYTQEVDYEVELAIVIGKDGKDICLEKAEDYIFGYTIGNDVSARDIQTKHGQWFKGKSLYTFSPLGPYLVHKSEIGFPLELNIVCKVNGEIRQKSNTKNLIFDISTIISDLSKGLTLKAGDIILTGTPAGVGMSFTPPKYLKSKDVIECYIENIGTLVNVVE